MVSELVAHCGTTVSSTEDGGLGLVSCRQVSAGEVILETSNNVRCFLSVPHGLRYVLHEHDFAEQFRTMQTEDPELFAKVLVPLSSQMVMFAVIFDDDWTLCPITGALVGPQWIYCRRHRQRERLFDGVGLIMAEACSTAGGRVTNHHVVNAGLTGLSRHPVVRNSRRYTGNVLGLRWRAITDFNIGDEIKILEH